MATWAVSCYGPSYYSASAALQECSCTTDPLECRQIWKHRVSTSDMVFKRLCKSSTYQVTISVVLRYLYNLIVNLFLLS